MTAWWSVFLGPFLSTLVGVMVAWVAINFDKRKATNQELIKKRILIYDSIMPLLNDFNCFFCVVGGWRNLNPPKILQIKRDCDRLIYVQGPLLSAETVKLYHEYIDLCFLTYRGFGENARLRVKISRLRRHWGTDWQEHWNVHFASEDEYSRTAFVKDAYNRAKQLAADVGVTAKTGVYQPLLGKLRHSIFTGMR